MDFEDFQRFYIAETASKQLAPSFFVMHDIARHEPANPFTIEEVESGTLPHASFPSPDESTVLAAPTNFVITTISYPNPLTAPVSNGPGSADWVVPYKKVQRVIQSVKVKWVVLSDLKRLGFPVDQAVLDLPLEGPHGTTIPFVVDAGGFVQHSTKWFGPDDQIPAALAGVKQAQATSISLDALMQLNRALMIAPNNQQVLSVFANQLYQGLLSYGGRLNGIPIENARLAERFNELYWTVKSQTDRFDLGLGMVTGGKAAPTPADYLYRMIPVMELWPLLSQEISVIVYISFPRIVGSMTKWLPFLLPRNYLRKCRPSKKKSVPKFSCNWLGPELGKSPGIAILTIRIFARAITPPSWRLN